MLQVAYYQKRSKHTYRLIASSGYNSKGKNRRVTKTVKLPENMTPSKREKKLNALCVLFQKQVDDGLYLDGEKTTFAEFTEKWFKDYAEINLAPATLASYRMKLEKRILPAIGHIKLSKLQPSHLIQLYHNLNEDNIRLDGRYTPSKRLKKYLEPIAVSQIEKATGISFKTCQRLKAEKDTDFRTAQKLCDTYELDINKMFVCKNDKKLSEKTIHNHHGIICSILSTAMKWNVIIHNPALRVDLKKAPKSKAEYYDDEQITVMLNALRDEPLMYVAMVYLTLHIGLRKGELTGLDWDDIGFDKSTVSINKQRHYVIGYGNIVSTPKTEAGARVVTASQTVLSILKEYKKQQNENRLKLGTAWKNDPYVFLHEDGSAISPQLPYKWFVRFLERHNLPKITFHQLRHTNASLLISAGEDVVTLSGRLGHADKNVTLNTYSHVIKSKEAQAANKMDAFYSSVATYCK